jgi:hypothetical protein
LSDVVRVYINGRGVDVAAGATALEAVRTFDNATAALLQAGDRALADSRGLPIGPDVIVYAGLILRIISGRRKQEPNDGASAS